MRCVACGRLPSEPCHERIHAVHDRLLAEPLWALSGQKIRRVRWWDQPRRVS